MMEEDDDIVRALGYVTIYAAYLEERIDNLLKQLSQFSELNIKNTSWKVSDKIKEAKTAFGKIEDALSLEMLEVLTVCKEHFDWRNELIHGVIYSPDYHDENLVSLRPNTPQRKIDAEEVYRLAKNLDELGSRIFKPFLVSHISNVLRKE